MVFRGMSLISEDHMPTCNPTTRGISTRHFRTSGANSPSWGLQECLETTALLQEPVKLEFEFWESSLELLVPKLGFDYSRPVPRGVPGHAQGGFHVHRDSTV